MPGVNHVRKALEEVCWAAAVDKRPLVGLVTRSRNNDQKQNSTGASASRMLGPSASSFPSELSAAPGLGSRPLEQVDNVGQNDQAYDGEEHQDENIQHRAVLGRRGPGFWKTVGCDSRTAPGTAPPCNSRLPPSP